MPVLLKQVDRNAPKTSDKYSRFPDRDFVKQNAWLTLPKKVFSIR